jgi:hypothetical protein
MVPVIGSKNDVVELKDHEMGTFAAFAHHLSKFGLGIQCSKCGQSLVGRNADQDATFSVTCGCREFKAKNPHHLSLQ